MTRNLIDRGVSAAATQRGKKTSRLQRQEGGHYEAPGQLRHTEKKEFFKFILRLRVSEESFLRMSECSKLAFDEAPRDDLTRAHRLDSTGWQPTPPSNMKNVFVRVR